jgi:hypothetical protein
MIETDDYLRATNDRTFRVVRDIRRAMEGSYVDHAVRGAMFHLTFDVMPNDAFFIVPKVAEIVGESNRKIAHDQ